MILNDGSEVALTSLDIRATEYTVGPGGAKAMPGSLPANVGYTYAVELSVDDAVAAGAQRVDFSTALPFYVENFLDFPVSDPVPLGYYDRQSGQWIGHANGIVLEILGVDEQGRAEIDIEGFGTPSNDNDLADIGIFDAERMTLADLYEPGTSLWRYAEGVVNRNPQYG